MQLSGRVPFKLKFIALILLDLILTQSTLGGELEISLHDAILEGNLRAVKKSVKRGADINHQYWDGSTPLIAAIEDGHVEIVEFLLESGAEVNLTDYEGATELGVAISVDTPNIRIVRMLFEKGAKASYKENDSEFKIPDLCVSAALGNLELTQFLINEGSDINEPFSDGVPTTPLIIALENENTILAEYLADQENKSYIGMSLVCAYGKYLRAGKSQDAGELIVRIIEAGLDIDQAIKNKYTENEEYWPLHLPVGNCDLQLTKLFIAAGVDVNHRQGSQSRTPLMLAAAKCDPAMVKLLIAAGANVSAVDVDGKLAYNYAEESFNNEIFELLAVESEVSVTFDRINKVMVIHHLPENASLMVTLPDREKTIYAEFHEDPLERLEVDLSEVGESESLLYDLRWGTTLNPNRMMEKTTLASEYELGEEDVISTVTIPQNKYSQIRKLKMKNPSYAPSFTLKDIQGNTFSSNILYASSKSAGHPVIINFIATWAAPAREQWRVLNQLSMKFPAIKIVTLSVDDDRTSGRVSTYAKNMNVEHPILLDQHQEVIKQFSSAESIPLLFIVDSDGMILFESVGFGKSNSSEISDTILGIYTLQKEYTLPHSMDGEAGASTHHELVLEKPAPVAFVEERYLGALKIADRSSGNQTRVVALRKPENMILDEYGRVSWTPYPDQTGFHDIVFKVTDDIVTQIDSFTMFVNTPPIITSKYEKIAYVGEPWIYTVTVRDPNANQDISYLVSESSVSNLTVGENGKISWTPSRDDIGVVSFRLSVSDGLRDGTQRIRLNVKEQESKSFSVSWVNKTGEELDLFVVHRDPDQRASIPKSNQYSHDGQKWRTHYSLIPGQSIELNVFDTKVEWMADASNQFWAAQSFIDASYRVGSEYTYPKAILGGPFPDEGLTFIQEELSLNWQTVIEIDSEVRSRKKRKQLVIENHSGVPVYGAVRYWDKYGDEDFANFKLYNLESYELELPPWSKEVYWAAGHSKGIWSRAPQSFIDDIWSSDKYYMTSMLVEKGYGYRADLSKLNPYDPFLYKETVRLN